MDETFGITFPKRHCFLLSKYSINIDVFEVCSRVDLVSQSNKSKIYVSGDLKIKWKLRFLVIFDVIEDVLNKIY